MLRHFFRTPMAYRGQPIGFALNQLGHAGLVGALPAFFVGPLYLPVIAAIYTAWEVGQIFLYNAEPFDAAEDWGFVMCGALAGATLSPWIAAVGLAFLIAGTLRRTGG